MILNCAKCGEEFKRAPSDRDAKYCSRKCFADARRSPPKKCAVCGKLFHARKRHAARFFKYCSQSCAAEARKRRVTKRCERCYKVFEVQWKHRRTRRYCSNTCRLDVKRKPRPSRQQLVGLIPYLSYRKIAELYCVSTTTVESWCRHYELRPPRHKKRITGPKPVASGYIGERYGV